MTIHTCINDIDENNFLFLWTCTLVILFFQMNMTCLAWAAGRGHTDVVKILIQKGAKVNTPDKVNR